jgi:hypothetical protein
MSTIGFHHLIGECAVRCDPPGREDFWILKIAHSPAWAVSR